VLKPAGYMLVHTTVATERMELVNDPRHGRV
jgi:hypothetical protein